MKQVIHLHDNGSHTWLTSIAPTSGDTHLGEGMGLHLIGENLVFDAVTTGNKHGSGPPISQRHHASVERRHAVTRRASRRGQHRRTTAV